jgi:hypothetical protein
VNFGGYVEMGGDKGVSSERTIIASIDATHLLRRFAADQALGVSHLWDMPEVVRDYLTTLDETKRVTSNSAASTAAKRAVRPWACYATRMAAWESAEAAAWESAEAAAMGAAWAAAKAAARDAARDAAWAAAWDAAEAAARDAAWGSAWDAAWGSAWGSAMDAAMQEFDRRVYEAFE